MEQLLAGEEDLMLKILDLVKQIVKPKVQINWKFVFPTVLTLIMM